MRKIIGSIISALAFGGVILPTMAADLKAPIYKAPLEVWSWTGVYVGGNVGYSWGRSSTDTRVSNNGNGASLFSTNSTYDLRGGEIGVQVGVNWQSGIWVGGFETDVQGTGQRGSASFTCPAGVCNTSAVVPAASRLLTGSISQKLAWFGTLR